MSASTEVVAELVMGSWTVEVDARVAQLLARLKRALGVEAVFVCRVHDGTQVFREVVTDRALPFRRGTVQDVAGSYCELVLDGRLAPVTPDTRSEPLTRDLVPTAAADIGCYLGVPVRLSDGSAVGTLCGFSASASTAHGASEVAVLRAAAEAVAELFEHENERVAALGSAFQQVRRVLADGGPDVVVQPVVGLSGQPVLFWEVLSRFARWGPGGPQEWFDAARRVGAGPALERAAVRGAVGVDPGTRPLSVNVSPQALCDPDTVDLLLSLPPGVVTVVEVVEEAVVDHALLVAVLRELRRGGLRIALDDAGAGSANLHHLASLELDVIKVDRDIVTPVCTSARHRDLVAAVVGYAERIGALVVAEGVETPDQADVLASLGVGYGQGWYLGMPVAGRPGLSGGTGRGAVGGPSGPSRP